MPLASAATVLPSRVMPGSWPGRDILHGTVSVLRDPAYRRLWVSGLCSSMARWMDLVAVGWIALQMTGSPFMVAVAAFARSAPMMVLGPFTGIVADRVSRAHLLLVTQAGGAVIALALLAMFAVDAARYWPLVALEGAFGILWSLDFPARRTALFSMLGATRVAQAVSLETVSMQIAKMVGPVVAGAFLRSLAGGGLGADPRHARERPRRRVGEPNRARGPAHHDRENLLLFPYQQLLSVFAQDVLAGGAAHARPARRRRRRRGAGGRAHHRCAPRQSAARPAVRGGRARRAIRPRRLLGVAVAGGERGADDRDGHGGIRFCGDAEHAGAAVGAGARARRRRGHPVRVHRHPAARRAGDRRARGYARRPPRVRAQRDRGARGDHTGRDPARPRPRRDETLERPATSRPPGTPAACRYRACRAG